jgi:hypothetical protein
MGQPKKGVAGTPMSLSARSSKAISKVGDRVVRIQAGTFILQGTPKPFGDNMVRTQTILI